MLGEGEGSMAVLSCMHSTTSLMLVSLIAQVSTAVEKETWYNCNKVKSRDFLSEDFFLCDLFVARKEKTLLE